VFEKKNLRVHSRLIVRDGFSVLACGVYRVVSLAILGKCSPEAGQWKCVSEFYSTYMIRYALTIAGFSC
jgi:hypothetical protein